MNDEVVLESLVKNLELLNLSTESELTNASYKDKKEYYQLLMAMGSLITKTCGNLNKIYEKTTELSLLLQYEEESESSSVEHVKHSYGSDLVITNKDGAKIDVEVKMSTVSEDLGYKSNWMFTIPVQTSNLDDIEKLVFASIVKKYELV